MPGEAMGKSYVKPSPSTIPVTRQQPQWEHGGSEFQEDKGVKWGGKEWPTWEMSSWQAASSRSLAFIFLLESICALSSCLLRFTRDLTSDFILLMYKRAMVNSSSMTPFTSANWAEDGIHSITAYNFQKFMGPLKPIHGPSRCLWISG